MRPENTAVLEDVVKLTRQLVAIPSESPCSNVAISDFLQEWLEARNFSLERIHYVDAAGEEKINLIAKLGSGTGGLGFFSHSDTVLGDPRGWDPFEPVIQNGRLVGRGSCDMKGPMAATMLAAAGIDAARLQRPVYIVITSDEERGYLGAHFIVENAAMLQTNWPEHAVVAEPTRLQPVYAHKGGALITVTAHGKAAHTSTEKGVSANFRIAPFLADMAELAPVFRNTERFKNYEFDPPTNGFNMVIDDGNCPSNVTAGKTVAKVSLRIMPNDHHDEQIAMIEEKAGAYDLETSRRVNEPFYTSPETDVVKAACRAANIPGAVTVPFGTEAGTYQKFTQAVIMGPGDIAQAHTVGEWIDIGQLQTAVGVYKNMIEQLCM